MFGLQLIFKPGKFAFSFTMGVIFFMGGFAMLQGPKSFLQSVFTRDRLPFTISSISSMVITLYAAMVSRSYILVVAASSVQILGTVVTSR